jgi:hypothetical protein
MLLKKLLSLDTYPPGWIIAKIRLEPGLETPAL